MIRTINGKRFDTSTAKMIAESSNGLPKYDPEFEREFLYRTPEGEWFMYIAAGPNSNYEDSFHNIGSRVEDIEPMSCLDAFKWCQCNKIDEINNEYFINELQLNTIC